MRFAYADPPRPVLRYHGGKWRLAPWLLSYFPLHRVYVEPFGGGASVLLRKPRSYAEVYNDLSDETVNVFRVLRDAPEELRRRLYLTPFSRSEFERTAGQGQEGPADDPIERARLTILRSFAGFGSASTYAAYRTGFRGNSNRSGTTPAHDWANYPACVEGFVERLRGVVIEHDDFGKLIPRHDAPTTLFYCDPPYLHVTRSRYHGRRGQATYRCEMTDDDHRRLAELLHGCAGMVVLSGYPSDLYDRELYPEWERHERQHLADGARKRTEVVWLNPACSRALANSRTQGSLLAEGAP